MIKVDNKNISYVSYGNKAIYAIYVGAKLVWSAIRSCFGSGFWQADRPWSRTDGWRRL